MARFFGSIGFGVPEEVSPGVWEDRITVRQYYGAVTRLMHQYTGDDKVLEDIRVNNQISVVADAFANENFAAIKYVEWMGTRWSVSNVEVSRPRLILELGKVYNGPSA